ncbi:MAG: ATP-binding cassette domain-containing protein [Thiolinea sp.]
MVNNTPPAERDIAMVFQSYALYPNMNVEKNISFGLEMRKMPRQQRRERVQQVAQMLQIEPLLKRKPSQLSGGQRQRVAMGRALVREPKFSCSTSRCPTWMPSYVSTCAPKSLLHQRLGSTIVSRDA